MDSSFEGEECATIRANGVFVDEYLRRHLKLPSTSPMKRTNNNRKAAPMHWLRNIPVSRKFFYAFGLVCGLCIALGTYTATTLRSIAARSAEVSENSFPAVIDLANIRDAINTMRREDLHLLLCATPECQAAEGPKRQAALDVFRAAAKDYEPRISHPGERELYQKISSGFPQYVEGSDRGYALLTAGKTGDAMEIFLSDALRVDLETALKACQEDFELIAGNGTISSHEATGISNRAIWINGGVTVLIVAFCALIGSLLTRVIAPRLVKVLAALEDLAAKDLTVHVQATGRDEIGRVADALDSSVAAMREVLQAVARGAETLSTTSTEIGARAVQSAGNANTQSSKTNQIAAAAQEMTATIAEIVIAPRVLGFGSFIVAFQA